MSEIFASIVDGDARAAKPSFVTPFEGYTAPRDLPLGASAPVATFPAKTIEGTSCILLETQHPEIVFSAFIMDSHGLVRSVLDASADGANLVLLADLCDCFALGTASLDLPDGIGRMPKVLSRFAMPTTPGQDVDVFRSASMPTWTLVAARPRQLLSGEVTEAACVYLCDDVVSDRLARSFHTGSIRARRLPGEYLP